VRSGGGDVGHGIERNEIENVISVQSKRGAGRGRRSETCVLCASMGSVEENAPPCSPVLCSICRRNSVPGRKISRIPSCTRPQRAMMPDGASTKQPSSSTEPPGGFVDGLRRRDARRVFEEPYQRWDATRSTSFFSELRTRTPGGRRGGGRRGARPVVSRHFYPLFVNPIA